MINNKKIYKFKFYTFEDINYFQADFAVKAFVTV